MVKDTIGPAVAITVVTNPINSANATNVTVSGIGEAGTEITLVADDGTNATTLYATVVGFDGTWSIMGIDVSSLNDGTITFTATSTDDVGNTATNSLAATKDTVAPTVAITSATDPINSGNATNVTVNGVGEAGTMVSVVADDGTNVTTPYTTMVAGDGTWSITGMDASILNDGTITLTATTTDASGNTTTNVLLLTKDTMSPAVAITAVTDPINSANATNVTVSGTSEASTLVSVVADDGTNATTPYTTMVAVDGTWSITGIDVSLLNDGTITFTATSVDAVGNTATASITATKTAGSAVSISAVTSPINAVTAHNVTVSGTSEPGETVTLVADDGMGSTSPITTTVAADGSWSITGIDVSALADGTITFTATATNAGNQSVTTSMTAVKDTIAPAVAITFVNDPLDLAIASNGTASGTGEAGATILLIVSDGLHAIVQTTIVAPDGTWSAAGWDASGLDDGSIAVYATAIDAAGNAAVSLAYTTKSTVALTSVTNPINAYNAASVTASGTGPVGGWIELVATDGTNASLTYTASVGIDGNWSISGIDVLSLADGTITLTATAYDNFGHSAQSSLTAAKDTIAPALAITSFTNPINIVTAHNIAASGTSEPGAVVTLSASDGLVTAVFTTTVAADGTWSFTGIDASALADGTITLLVTATDAFGNVTSLSQMRREGHGRPGRDDQFRHVSRRSEPLGQRHG